MKEIKRYDIVEIGISKILPPSNIADDPYTMINWNTNNIINDLASIAEDKISEFYSNKKSFQVPKMEGSSIIASKKIKPEMNINVGRNLIDKNAWLLENDLADLQNDNVLRAIQIKKLLLDGKVDQAEDMLGRDLSQTEIEMQHTKYKKLKYFPKKDEKAINALLKPKVQLIPKVPLIPLIPKVPLIPLVNVPVPQIPKVRKKTDIREAISKSLQSMTKQREESKASRHKLLSSKPSPSERYNAKYGDRDIDQMLNELSKPEASARKITDIGEAISKSLQLMTKRREESKASRHKLLSSKPSPSARYNAKYGDQAIDQMFNELSNPKQQKTLFNSNDVIIDIHDDPDDDFTKFIPDDDFTKFIPDIDLLNEERSKPTSPSQEMVKAMSAKHKHALLVDLRSKINKTVPSDMIQAIANVLGTPEKTIKSTNITNLKGQMTKRINELDNTINKASSIVKPKVAKLPESMKPKFIEAAKDAKKLQKLLKGDGIRRNGRGYVAEQMRENIPFGKLFIDKKKLVNNTISITGNKNHRINDLPMVQVSENMKNVLIQIMNDMPVNLNILTTSEYTYLQHLVKKSKLNFSNKLSNNDTELINRMEMLVGTLGTKNNSKIVKNELSQTLDALYLKGLITKEDLYKAHKKYILK